MTRLLGLPQALLALGLLAGVAAAGNGNSDDDGKGRPKATVESRLLKILKDRGVLKEEEFNELVELGARMRSEEALTSDAFELELAKLSAVIEKQAAASKKAEPDVKVSYKFGSGVTFKSGDDFSMTLGGYMQTRFSYISPDGQVSNGQDDRATFDVRRARIKLEGVVLKDTAYKVEFDVAASNTATNTASLRDAYIDHKFSPEFHIRGGQFKRPYSRQSWTSSSAQELPDRSSVVERFRSVNGSDRSDGVMLWGEVGEKKEFEWYGMLDNGEAYNNGTPNAVNLGPASSGLNAANSSNDDSSGLEAVGRVVWNPLGTPPGYSEGDLERSEEAKLGIGLQYMYSPERRGNPLGLTLNSPGSPALPAGTLPEYDTSTYGLDVAFKYMGFFATAEAYYRTVTAASNLGNTAGHFQAISETGWFVQGGYLFGEEKNKGFEAVARYATIDFDQSNAPANVVGGDTKIDDYTAGLNYYVAGHNLKLLAAYTYRVEQKVASASFHDQIFQLQAQIKF